MQQIQGWNGGRINAFTDGVEFEFEAQKQVHNVAGLKFVSPFVAVMPDVHWGVGATVGSVIPTKGAIIPAAVGVDIGCGMMAVQTTLKASDLPDNLHDLRCAIEAAVPHGTPSKGNTTVGAWREVPERANKRFGTKQTTAALRDGLYNIVQKYPQLETNAARVRSQFGTLGGGNHFIEVCLDVEQNVWAMLHSGSRGIGNAIGKMFIAKARELHGGGKGLPDADLAWLNDGTEEFRDYIEAMLWAQDYARENRNVMMESVVAVLREKLPPFTFVREAVNCHHNFTQREHHFGEDLWVTRKGAVSAREGELGIIPGSMGARSYIVRGLGNPDSFHSCSHGAGRRLSRGKAKATFTVEDHIKATEGVECRKDASVIDETPGAYKDIDAVMAAQSALVEPVAVLKQVLCVKG